MNELNIGCKERSHCAGCAHKCEILETQAGFILQEYFKLLHPDCLGGNFPIHSL